MPSDTTREKILAAATAVFAERDFHRVQVSEVAVRAGVGKGTLYLYFPTKDELHAGALEASLRRLADDLEAIAADAALPLEAALRAIVLCILRFFWKRQHLLTVVQRYEQQARGRGRRPGRHRALGAVAQILARHRLGGTAATRRLSAAFLLGLARAGILEHGADDKPEALAQRIVGLYLHGVTAPARATKRRAS
jgi:AcrR family transcriptional regulator